MSKTFAQQVLSADELLLYRAAARAYHKREKPQPDELAAWNKLSRLRDEAIRNGALPTPPPTFAETHLTPTELKLFKSGGRKYVAGKKETISDAERAALNKHNRLRHKHNPELAERHRARGRKENRTPEQWAERLRRENAKHHAETHEQREKRIAPQRVENMTPERHAKEKERGVTRYYEKQARMARVPYEDVPYLPNLPGAKCACCGTKWNLTLDHKQPRRWGGWHVLDNCQVLCGECNRSKLAGTHCKKHNKRLAPDWWHRPLLLKSFPLFAA